MNQKNKLIIVSFIMLGLGFVIGKFSGSSPKGHHDHGSHVSGSSAKAAEVWSCSMHPQIKLPKKGKCPICFMSLIPLNSSHSDVGERALLMSKAALALAEIETEKVERGKAYSEINMVGKVAVDTTKINDVIILADGQIRKLYVNYEGVPIKKGDHLAEIYSPKIYAAGQDYLVLLNSLGRDKELLSSTKTKLILLGAPKSYIDSIQNNKKVPETFILRSPIEGVVENILGYQGMWVKAGQLLCRIIDMSQLWINLDAYETDITWIRYGQEVRITAQAIPGKEFKGLISFIPPRMNDKTRTTKVRVNITNEKSLLKPDMFVSATVKAEINENGNLVLNGMEGKWISPMHPEIIKDKPSSCDICGMKLVKAEELGYKSNPLNEMPLLVPETSVMITGKRAVVYIRKKGSKPIFEGREIVLGPKTGSYFVVLGGLEEGELVVTKGNFKIDSALQIQAKPSMMSMKGGESLIHNIENQNIKIKNEDLNNSLEDFLSYYLEIHNLLSNDQFDKVPGLSKTLKEEMDYFDYSTLNEAENKVFSKLNKLLISSMEHIEHLTDIKIYRKNFKWVSKATITLLDKVKYKDESLSIMFCSMANSEWVQKGEDVKNPFYGKSMLKCGEVKKTLSPKTTN